MSMHVSNRIISDIRNSDYDKETQNFLIQALSLEFKRDKSNIKQYSREYDKLIEKYVFSKE